MTQKNRHLRTIARICRAVSSQLRHVWTIGKKVVKQQYFPTCPHNMANFGPLTAEIGSGVWGTPANFNGFRVLAALPQRRHFMSTSCVLLYWQRYCTAVQQRALAKLRGVVQGMELRNFRRGHHLYSAAMWYPDASSRLATIDMG